MPCRGGSYAEAFVLQANLQPIGTRLSGKDWDGKQRIPIRPTASSSLIRGSGDHRRLLCQVSPWIRRLFLNSGFGLASFGWC